VNDIFISSDKITVLIVYISLRFLGAVFIKLIKVSLKTSVSGS